MKTDALALDPNALRAFRALFPALEEDYDGKRLAYFDSACTALKSAPAADAMREFMLRWGGCGGKRSTHRLSQKGQVVLDAARAKIAAFVGAQDANEIVFTSGVTESAHLLAEGFPFEDGRDEVVLSDLEHNSVFLPFLELEKRGKIRLKICPTRRGALDLDRLESLVGERTALVALTHSSNVFGGELPIGEACRIAHRRGALIFVDQAQRLATHRGECAALGVDFAAFSGHKLGGPFGVGALYGKERLLNRLRVAKPGGGTVKEITVGPGGWEARYLDAPARLEAGTPNSAGIVGLAAAVDLIEKAGVSSLRAHVGALVDAAASGLAAREGVEPLGQPELLRKGGIVSFAASRADFSVPDFNLFLNHELPGHVIALRVGEHCAHLLHRSQGLGPTLRLSFFGYNEPAELDAFFAALDAYLGEL